MAEVKRIQRVAVNKLIPYENNAKKHSEKQIEKLSKSIEEFGFISPVLIDKDFNIIAGHGRVEAAKASGIKEVPCVSIEGLTEEQRRAYILADNRLSEFGEWDKELVQIELESLEGVELLGELDFSLPEVDLTTYYGDERERTMNAYNLDKAEGADFTEDFWEMPIIENNDFVPDSLLRFHCANTAKDFNTGIHFFTDDYRFERVWNKPEKYTELLKKFECILSPDFSLYLEMPLPMMVWNVYRSRFIGQYYQRQGIKVIPTIQWARENTFSFCFAGIPKGSIVAISTIGIKGTDEQKKIFQNGVDAMIETIEPSKILVYGGNVGDYHGIDTVFYDNDGVGAWRGKDHD